MNRKVARYHNIDSAATDAGYTADLITFEVESRGLSNIERFMKLEPYPKKTLNSYSK